jgi:hypothetical protein
VFALAFEAYDVADDDVGNGVAIGIWASTLAFVSIFRVADFRLAI